jgi:predicted phage tail protein
MEHKIKLEELNKVSLEKLEDYVKTKEALREEDHAKLQQAKDEWQVAWNKLMDVLMVLERIEI